MNCEHCGKELSDARILSHVQSLRSRMRKRKRGGRPASLYRCPRCGTGIAGRKLLEAHLALCPAPPPQPVGPEDFVPWTPDDA